MLIDTHCHLNFDRYDADRDAVIQRAKKTGVNRIIIPAVDLASCTQLINLCKQHEGIYGAVGIHPNSTTNFDENTVNILKSMADEDKVIAIGEIGLDYYWDKSPKSTQADAFKAQLALAHELELPVIIHNREASMDIMPILEEWATTLSNSLKSRAGVLHSFSAPPEIAERALDAGFYLGFTGPITFKKANELRDIARNVPLDRILVETDAPFLTPTPFRGKRNEPAYIPHIVERLASLKQISIEEMGAITTRNAEMLFQLPPHTE